MLQSFRSSKAASTTLTKKENTMKLLSPAAAQKRVAKLTAAPNHGIFEMAPFGKRSKPHCLYFYYLTKIDGADPSNPKFEMRIYYHDNCEIALKRGYVKKITKKLILNARRDCIMNGAKLEQKGFCPPM